MKTLITKIAIGASALALGIGGVAYAAMPARHGGMDADGNGVVTRAEAQQKAAAMFTRMDANHDGKIDSADRQARMAEMRTKMFSRLDANNDGSISRAEFMDAKRPDREGKPGGEGMRGGMGMHRHGGHHGMMEGGMMEGAMGMRGANASMTSAQFTDAAMQRFDAMDTNHDGQITKDERQAARSAMKAKWEARRAAGTQD